MINDNILTISDYSWGQAWEMHFDLLAIAAAAGMRERIQWRDDKGKMHYAYETKYSLTKARKMCQLVCKHITGKEAVMIDDIFKTNPKLYNIWRQYVRF